MDPFLFRFRNALVLVGLLLLQAIGLAVQIRRPVETGAPDGTNVTLARSWVVGVVSPIERVVHFAGHTVRFGWSDYLDLRGVRAKDAALERELAQMRLRQAALAEDALQGQRLQALLAFQDQYVSSTVAAQVVGTSGSDLSRVLYLDKGAADGLRPDMPVITPDGIVGKIRDVFPMTAPHVAQVLLINDQTSGAGVILANTRIRAIVHGSTGGQVMITNLTPDERIKPGELLLTSGGDQVFPRGLPVGTVVSIAVDPVHQPYTAIRVKPAANLFQLEEVLVITGTAPKLPPGAQAELVADAATTGKVRAAAERAAAAAAAVRKAADQQKEEEARSAADIVADRLPSLAPVTDARPASAAEAKEPGGAVPRPLPTVHTDRYSPGTTPPAASLTPGGARAASPPAPPKTPEPTTHDPERR